MLVTVWCPVYMVSEYPGNDLPESEWDYRWYRRDADLPVVPHTGDFFVLEDGSPERIVAALFYNGRGGDTIDIVLEEAETFRSEGNDDFFPDYQGEEWEMLEECTWDFPFGTEESLPNTSRVYRIKSKAKYKQWKEEQRRKGV
jgi:hypothetical protein